MTYVVAEPCIKCKYTDCVDVCPVDCFYEGENFLVIHPDECIDCGACVPECPTKAIFSEDDLPEKWEEYGRDQRRLVQQWPNIAEKKEALARGGRVEGRREQAPALLGSALQGVGARWRADPMRACGSPPNGSACGPGRSRKPTCGAPSRSSAIAR